MKLNTSQQNSKFLYETKTDCEIVRLRFKNISYTGHKTH